MEFIEVSPDVCSMVRAVCRDTGHEYICGAPAKYVYTKDRDIKLCEECLKACDAEECFSPGEVVPLEEVKDDGVTGDVRARSGSADSERGTLVVEEVVQKEPDEWIYPEDPGFDHSNNGNHARTRNV